MPLTTLTPTRHTDPPGGRDVHETLFMSKHLVRDLENLQQQILAMAGSVEEAIYKSIQALQEHDKALAQEVISGDNKIDELDNAVTEECLKLMALHQPVASDLRRIATVF